jgi:hypothetical protein
MTVGASDAHMKAMKQEMEYCVGKKDRGLMLKPDVKWNDDPSFKLAIRGISDSDFAKNPETRKSVSGNSTFLCGAPVIQRSTMQIIVALLVMEAELFAATNNAQDMLYTKRIIYSLGLQVQLPMILEVDNNGAEDLVYNYSVGGRTRHVEMRQYFLRQLKEENTIKFIWTPGELISSDVYTKNLTRTDFEKHTKTYVGNDKYMKG